MYQVISESHIRIEWWNFTIYFISFLQIHICSIYIVLSSLKANHNVHIHIYESIVGKLCWCALVTATVIHWNILVNSVYRNKWQWKCNNISVRKLWYPTFDEYFDAFKLWLVSEIIRRIEFLRIFLTLSFLLETLF